VKKIIILSDYFPPSNLTPSERIYSFCLYLSQMGYYPIVVTRNWDIPIKKSVDEHKATGKEIVHIKENGYEVYYVPYKPTLRSRLFTKLHGKKNYTLYLATSFVYSIGENLSSSFTSLRPLSQLCKKLLTEQKDIKLMLISGSPFQLFKFGYLLKKQFNIKWIADYRDDWNTNELAHNSMSKKFVQFLSKPMERKWVNSASFFVSVSDHYVKKISGLIPAVPGYTILNGYLENNYSQLEKQRAELFTIAYVGSLYPNQPIEIFLNGFKKFIDNNKGIKCRLCFVGLMAQPVGLSRVENLIKGYEEYVSYTERVDKATAISIQNKATALLLCSHKNIKGTPGSKLYEYIALQKPVLVCPSDGEIVEETLTETGQGLFANNEEECAAKLEILYKNYSNNEEVIDINMPAVKKYSRYENAKKLSKLLNEL